MADGTILDAMTDPKLFGPVFGKPSFAGWRALLAGFYALPVDEGQLDTFKALTRLEAAPAAPCDELCLAVRRRGGKSHIAALVATHEAAFQDHRDKLAPGEWATVLLIAANRPHARPLIRYVPDFFDNQMLKPLGIAGYCRVLRASQPHLD